MNRSNQAGRFPNPPLALLVGVTLPGYMFAGFLHMPGDGPPLAFSLQALDLFAGLVGFVFGAVTGLAVAGLQWIILKVWLPKA